MLYCPNLTFNVIPRLSSFFPTRVHAKLQTEVDARNEPWMNLDSTRKSRRTHVRISRQGRNSRVIAADFDSRRTHLFIGRIDEHRFATIVYTLRARLHRCRVRRGVHGRVPVQPLVREAARKTLETLEMWRSRVTVRARCISLATENAESAS